MIILSFLACRIYKETDSNGVKSTLRRIERMHLDELSPGDLVVRVHYSGVNYKDALAATGRGAILKHFPLNAGIDLAGVVVSSSDPRFAPGQAILVNGCGLGESHDGGLAEFARIPSDWAIPLPQGLSMKQAMIIGTAGFTAGLAIHRMLSNGQNHDLGPIVVTGASGGVGSMAISILSTLGFDTIAVSGRENFYQYLSDLGANRVCSAAQLALSERPLDKVEFGGAIDNVGGQLLSQILAHTQLWGNVASIGLADTHQFNSSVFPMILRGVSLLGVSSTNCPMPLRKEIWSRLATDLKPLSLDKILAEEVALKDVSAVFNPLLDRKRYGRTIVKCLT
ncbi:MAG: YhdH/YhfP family quinone oxidoreductase [Enterobacterales bacterium]|nr:YhdH/YhfP family quinone oxidoreductase [Enterobacterales bacterium]